MNDPAYDKLELYFNKQVAEITVLRVILQSMMTHLFAANPEMAEERLQEWKSDVIGILKRQTTDPPDDQGQQRTKQLSLASGRRFFAELEEALSRYRNKTGQPDSEAGKLPAITCAWW